MQARDLNAIAAEMLRRKRARESLVGFSQAITIPGSPLPTFDEDDPDSWVFAPIEERVASHHVLLMNEVERCVRTHGGRLMIFLPPGSAKSTYACAVAPPWIMGAFPGVQILMVSASLTPIIRASKKARQIVKSREYRNLWSKPVGLMHGSRSAEEWETDNGSRLFASGMLGDIIGSRADVTIIDDPVKGREAADSEAQRRAVLQCYQDDVLTRRKPGNSLILIQTRWHLDDLAGSILPEDYDGRSGDVLCRDGKVWRVLCIPAEAERDDDPLGRKKGEMLWKEWFDEDHWSTFRKVFRTWNALFQQRPQPDSGGQFQEDWFHRFTLAELPKDIERFATGDYAVTKKMVDTKPDYTAIGCWAIDSAGDLWLYDGHYGQESTDVTSAKALDLMDRDEIAEHVAESGVIRRAMEPTFKKAMEERNSFHTMTYLATSNDKVALAQPFRARANQRKVHIIKGPFGDWVIGQLKAFPFGTIDDGVDMCSLAGRAMDKWYNPEESKPAAKKPAPKPGTMEYLEYEDQSARREREGFME